MTQKKTVVPGMESSYTSNDECQDFYSRSSSSPHKGTMIPEMQYNTRSEKTTGVQKNNLNTSKPVVGFLYSISRQGIGEFWPLHIGPNSIGASPNCDITLSEGTVSSEHATIVVRKMRNPEKTVASISDSRSTNGTMVNGESLWMDAKECFNNDIITIGMNYEMVLILIDTNAMGLKVSENFIPLQQQQNIPNSYMSNNATRPGGDIPPFFEEQDIYNSSNNGTVGLDNSSIKRGGTTGM